MKITFTKNQLAEYFPEIEQKRINSVWLALNHINSLDRDYFDVWARKHLPSYMYSRSTKRIDAVLWFCDRHLECYGVEAINTPDCEHSPYWIDITSLYLNSGDVYSATLIFDIKESKLHLTTLGDWFDDCTTKEFEEV